MQAGRPHSSGVRRGGDGYGDLHRSARRVQRPDTRPLARCGSTSDERPTRCPDIEHDADTADCVVPSPEQVATNRTASLRGDGHPCIELLEHGRDDPPQVDGVEAHVPLEHATVDGRDPSRPKLGSRSRSANRRAPWTSRSESNSSTASSSSRDAAAAGLDPGVLAGRAGVDVASALAFLHAGDRVYALELLRKAKQSKRLFHDAFWMPEERYYALALDPDKRQVRSIASNAASETSIRCEAGARAAWDRERGRPVPVSESLSTTRTPARERGGREVHRAAS